MLFEGGGIFPKIEEIAMRDVKMTVEDKVKIFKALAHPIRLRIVEKLADGEQCVCVILEMFHVDMSTLSRHLSVLKNAGIVADEKRGKNVYYRLKCPCILKVGDCLEKSCLKEL